MSLGKRRAKVPRAQLRPSNPIAIHQVRLARQRDRLARLAVVGVAVLLTAAVVHGSGPPFTYRLGQQPNRELRVNVPSFQRRNLSKTNMLRQVAADKVAPFMANDPASLRALADRLEDLVEAVAKAPSLQALPEGLRTSWKLTSALFDDLKAATDTPERVSDLHARIQKAFVPLIRDGVLGPVDLPVHEESRRTLAVHRTGRPPSEAHEVPRERVTPERVARPDGPVAREFQAAFDPPQLRQTMFALVAEKLAGTPTLTYEEQLTTQAREAARNRLGEVYDTYSRGDVLVEQGQKIEDEQLMLLRLEHEMACASLGFGDRVRRTGSIVVLVAALFALLGYYIYRHEIQIGRDVRRIAGLCALVVGAMGLVRLLAVQPWDAELIPVALTAMILAI